MITPPYEWTFWRVVWATLVLISVVLSFWLLYRFSQVFFILFIAILMGTVIRPATVWLYSRGAPRMAGGIFIYLLLLAFYWTLYGSRNIQSLLLLVPIGQRESIRDLVSAIETKVGAFVAGQGVL